MYCDEGKIMQVLQDTAVQILVLSCHCMYQTLVLSCHCMVLAPSTKSLLEGKHCWRKTLAAYNAKASVGRG
jgi:hypothetical protein